MPRPAAFVLPLLSILAPAVRSEGHWPLDTEAAAILPAATAQLEIGLAAARDDHRVLFPDERGRSATLPRLGLRAGLGEWGEIALEGEALRWFDPEDGETAHGTGDWWVRTKVRIGPTGRRWSWAAQFGAKIPVASDDDGLGTDLADVELLAIASLAAGAGRFDLNLGVDLLGSPFRERSQQDLLRYAGAYWWPTTRRLSVGGEIAGRAGGDFFPAMSLLRLGVRLERGPWRLDAAAAAGLTDAAPSFELRGGATFSFGRG